MISILIMGYENFVRKVHSISVNNENLAEKEKIEQRVEESGICGKEIPGFLVSDSWIRGVAEILEVSPREIKIEDETYGYDAEIEELGFSKEDRIAIENHFLCHVSMADWEEMELFDELDDEENKISDEGLLLPSGKLVLFGGKLLHRELLAQMD